MQASKCWNRDTRPATAIFIADVGHNSQGDFLRQRADKSTLAEDAALLRDLTVQGRQRIAVKVRLGEKEILALAALRVHETIAAIPCISRADADSSQM